MSAVQGTNTGASHGPLVGNGGDDPILKNFPRNNMVMDVDHVDNCCTKGIGRRYTYIQANRLEMNRPTPVCCGIGCGLLDGFCKAGTWGLGCGLIFDACCMKMCPASGYVDHVHTMYFDDFTLWQNSCCHYEYIPQRQGCCGKCCYKNTNGMCCTIDKVNLSCCPKMCLCLKCCCFKDGCVLPFIDGIADPIAVTAALNERINYFKTKRKDGGEPTAQDATVAYTATAPQPVEMSKYAVGEVQPIA